MDGDGLELEDFVFFFENSSRKLEVKCFTPKNVTMRPIFFSKWSFVLLGIWRRTPNLDDLISLIHSTGLVKTTLVVFDHQYQHTILVKVCHASSFYPNF